MMLKQVGFKPRSNSQSSASSDSTVAKSEASTPVQSPTATSPTKDAFAGNNVFGTAGRRRSSAAGSGLYGRLNEQKRGSLDDKRAGFAEQKPGSPGLVSGFWNKVVRGT